MANIVPNVRFKLELDKKFLIKCLCSILIVQKCTLVTASPATIDAQKSLSFSSLIPDESDNEDHPKNVIHRTGLGMNIDQFKDVENDLDKFHKVVVQRLKSIDAQDGLDSDNEEHSAGLLERFTNAARDFTAPPRHYLNLVTRYRTWRHDYNQLQAAFGTGPDGKPILKDCVDFLRLEYAKIDNELMTNVCYNHSPEVAKLKESESENVDFVLNIINKLIDRLEKKLTELRQKGPEAVLREEQAQKEDQRGRLEMDKNERSIQVASDRAKRIAVHSVANLAARETIAIGKMLVYKWVSSFVRNIHPETDLGETPGLMSVLEPIILVMGSEQSSVIIDYLRNVKFRVTIKLLTQFLTKLECRLDEA